MSAAAAEQGNVSETENALRLLTKRLCVLVSTFKNLSYMIGPRSGSEGMTKLEHESFVFLGLSSNSSLL
ncbi:hypothetical protein FHL15_010482 [Xylaria flabelliformis]|uniref:Uncharacterized protein n=1 Tax=Xylaria flabelliformis TaxID=2512241 RepID=A0A553HL00_9PEZI|nr:hypothetical protein FHL15_010482 [Xylaria flabelliformis]